ncbi:conserved hypothetical protein [Microbacterium sp. 8M]|uniref:hypothetical protein n=1 Tax=Microbacterium sp. 8M TaxID=2653153 RepID=UPI0012F36E81|nr:hypothetical protein [Microbacterium sp. 8M]VXB48586.1 conserved hypothetical protein [Microbacterium sp. 8M]
MTMHPSMSYRITTLEIEQAAVRAERARMMAEHADQIVRRDGILRRALRRLQASAGTSTTARTASDAPAVPAAAARPAEPAQDAAPAAPVERPAAPAVASAAPLAEPASASVATDRAADEVRDRELVGCASHAA